MRAVLLAGAVALGWAVSAQAAPIVPLPAAGTTVYTNAAAFAAATIGSTTIGFNGIIVPPATFAPLPNQPRGGLTFANGDPNVSINVTSKSFYAPGFIYPGDFIVDASNTDPTNTLIISVAGGTRAIGIDFGALFANVGSSVTLSNGTSVTDVATADQGSTEFLGFVSAAPITTLTLTVTGDSYVLEDALLATPVPEPASLALLGLGLVGIAARRRRQT